MHEHEPDPGARIAAFCVFGAIGLVALGYLFLEGRNGLFLGATDALGALREMMR